MTRAIFILFMLFLSPKLSKSQRISSINIGKKYEIYSNVLNETRTVCVYNTMTGDTSGFYKNNLPVIYVLDGEEQFITAATIAKYLAEYQDRAPRVLVVGIWNKDRNRDFTPSYDSTNPIKNAGGSYKFAEFIQKELSPFVKTKFNAGATKIFIGTSFGGLFGITALTKFPDLFDDYILIDPSFWWHKQQIMKELLHQINDGNYSKKSLFVSIANTLPQGADSNTVRNLDPDTCSMTSVFNFVDQLRLSRSEIRWSYKYFPQENHWTVALPSMYEGLRYIYKEHLLKP